jgi:hypothetical protein
MGPRVKEYQETNCLNCHHHAITFHFADANLNFFPNRYKKLQLQPTLCLSRLVTRARSTKNCHTRLSMNDTYTVSWEAEDEKTLLVSTVQLHGTRSFYMLSELRPRVSFPAACRRVVCNSFCVDVGRLLQMLPGRISRSRGCTCGDALTPADS